MASQTGVVKKWCDDRDFGFISVEGNPQDMFFHASDVVGKQRILEGDRVQFAIGNSRGKQCGKAVRVLGQSGSEDDWFAAVLAQDIAKLRRISSSGLDINVQWRSKRPCKRCSGSGDGQGGYSGEDIQISRRNWTCRRCEGRRIDPSMPTAVVLAIDDAKNESLATLIQLRADVNKLSPLPHAVSKEDGQSVWVLLQANADPNVKCDDMDHPLIIAARKGHGQIVQSLLESGADANARGMSDNYDDYGDEVEFLTAAEMAQKHGHSEIANVISTWTEQLVLTIHVSVPAFDGRVEVVCTDMSGNERARVRANPDQPFVELRQALHPELAVQRFRAVLPGGHVLTTEDDSLPLGRVTYVASDSLSPLDAAATQDLV